MTVAAGDLPRRRAPVAGLRPAAAALRGTVRQRLRVHRRGLRRGDLRLRRGASVQERRLRRSHVRTAASSHLRLLRS